MRIGRIPIQILFLLILVTPASAESPSPEQRESRRRFILIPMADPLAEFDANRMVWHSSVELFNSGGNALIRFTGLDKSKPGRALHAGLSLYFSVGMSYYSHEIAHSYSNQVRRHFWIDLSDWSNFVPAYINHDALDIWNEEDLEYSSHHPFDRRINTLITHSTAAGLYQDRLNSRFTARLSALNGSTGLTDGMAYCFSSIHEFEYIILAGNEPIGLYLNEHGYFADYNDVTGYIKNMGDFDIEISKDTWLIISGLSTMLSGQMWNSIHSAYRYVFHADPYTPNIRFDIGSGTTVSPPNFYLFPTLYGLYLDSETHIRGLFREKDDIFISLGTGLDRLGLEKTGPVDRLRFGAKYHPPGSFHFLDIAPFFYIDFTGGMKQTGHSVGVSVETGPYRRFFLTATLEHNRGDIIEQTIKFKDDGFYFIAGLGFRL